MAPKTRKERLVAAASALGRTSAGLEEVESELATQEALVANLKVRVAKKRLKVELAMVEFDRCLDDHEDESLTERVLAFLRRYPRQPFRARELTTALGTDNPKSLGTISARLAADGRIRRGGRGAYYYL